MKLLALLPTLVLAACAATSVPYTPAASPKDPHLVVQRILSEQPTRETPEYVRVNSDYFEYADGAVTEVNRWTRRESTKQNVVRVYYSSINEMKLYQKRSTWYVVPESKQGKEMTEVSMASESDAKAFIDAVTALRASSTAR